MNRQRKCRDHLYVEEGKYLEWMIAGKIEGVDAETTSTSKRLKKYTNLKWNK